MIREAASKTRLCKVSRPICIISVMAASLSLHPSSPSFSSRKLESREIGIRGFQTTSSRKRRKRQDGFLEIFDNKNFIQDLFSKKVNSCRLNETIIFERLMIRSRKNHFRLLLVTNISSHFQVSNCFKFSPERKKRWIFEIGNPRYKNFIQMIYLDLFSDY